MTDDLSAVRALAAATAALLDDHHTGDVLQQLMQDCSDVLGSTSAAILVRDGGRGLALLSSSSHRVADLELLQAQSLRGPCVDTIDVGEHVGLAGADALVDRWGEVGQAILDAGFDAVDAYPLRWYGKVLGGLNVFRQPATPVPDDVHELGQAFADVASLVVVHTSPFPKGQVAARVHEAVVARATVEQAKGVLAYLHKVSPEDAFDLLVERSQAEGGTVTETAVEVIAQQSSPEPH